MKRVSDMLATVKSRMSALVLQYLMYVLRNVLSFSWQSTNSTIVNNHIQAGQLITNNLNKELTWPFIKKMPITG